MCIRDLSKPWLTKNLSAELVISDGDQIHSRKPYEVDNIEKAPVTASLQITLPVQKNSRVFVMSIF